MSLDTHDAPARLDDEPLAAHAWTGGAPSRVSEVYGEILARIIRGDLPGGTELKSTRLAAELGVSRTPVVQALARLQADGIVTQEMNMRAMVTPGAENWLVEIHELRLLLEPAAAARAALHMPMEVIEQLVHQAAAVAPDSSSDWAERARDFDFALHRAIADHSGNQPLRGAIYKCWEYKRLSYELGDDRLAFLVRGHHEHLSILTAIQARDGATASAAMELHLRQASAYRPEKRVV